MVRDARLVGRDQKHLKLSLNTLNSPNTLTFNAIAFNMASLYPQLLPDKPIDIAYTIILNEWNGRKNIELKIKDIKLDSREKAKL